MMGSRYQSALFFALALVTGCHGSKASMPERPIGADATVTLLDGVVFDNGHRNQSADVVLAPDAYYSKITLHIDLECPSGGCDPYDRRASIGLVGKTDGSVIEIGRFITPFRVAGAWDVDVTDLQPLLTGAVTVQGFIDTWIGPPRGWSLTATLVYVGGMPAEVPVAVQALPWHGFPFGDPSMPLASTLPPQMLTLPAGASHAALRVTVTGHGQGNLDNCGEFCAKQHTVLVDGAPADSQTVWRYDCDENPINKQLGTWQLQRAGWCPGADVKPWLVKLGAHTAPFTVTYAIEDYVNTCSPSNCMPNDCALCATADCGTPKACEDNGGVHTLPTIDFSALLIAYQ
jgi:Peptide-N-glycosidase F, C terminal/Peptide-N-glycosidase F, N terminal